MKKMETRIIVYLGLAVISLSSALPASPGRYDAASADVQEYVVDCLAGCVKQASVALTRSVRNGLAGDAVGGIMKHQYALGLKSLRCVEMLKGDPTLGTWDEFFYYNVPRRTIGAWDEARELGVNGEVRYFVDGRDVTEGKARWVINPPYDPFASVFMEEFFMLVFMTPEHRVDRRRMLPLFFPRESASLAETFQAAQKNKISAEEFVEKINAEAVFSNRVFRLNEGCVFQVDYSLPKGLLQDQDEREKKLDRLREECTNIMHLSAEEVSEITCLAYAVDGNLKGYAEACHRCPKVLRPVPAIGRRSDAGSATPSLQVGCWRPTSSPKRRNRPKEENEELLILGGLVWHNVSRPGGNS